MTSTSENDQNTYFELEDALQTYPIVSAPANFSKSVMQNVRTAVPKPQFQLSWIDYALTFFGTSMVGLVLLLWQFIPTQWVVLVRFQAFVLWERSTRFPYGPSWSVGCVLVFLAILFSFVFFVGSSLITKCTMGEKIIIKKNTVMIIFDELIAFDMFN